MIRKITFRDADFEHPMEMLKACHERIEMQCETLQRLAAHLPVSGCDAQAQQAASNIMRYFDSAGRHHHEDEEQDVFPHLTAASKGKETARVASLVSRLTAQHREMEKAWSKLRDLLATIAYGDSAPLDQGEVEHFCGLYRDHISLENENLIPLATQLITVEDLAAIGRSMAARRGVVT